MKLISLAGALLALAGGIVSLQGGEQVLILTGDTQGYLSPCGCTSPMIGGIRRRATLIRSLTVAGRTTILDNGAFTAGFGRQDEMKAETLAQMLADIGVTAINLAPSDARLGQGMLGQLSQLSGGRFVSTSLTNPEDASAAASVPSGPFLIGGATDAPAALAAPLSARPVKVDVAVKALVDAAQDANLKPILMLQGSKESAVRLAKAFPSLALIQYSSQGTPPPSFESVGTTVLATAGEHGKYVVRLGFQDGRFTSYKLFALGPQYRDDPATSRYYAAYLRRVSSEKLLEALPRRDTASFAGSWSCSTCHAKEIRIWKASGHRHALQTLEKLDHDRDPDCVSCHVVGLPSTKGFRSRPATPGLADVGCESCHGPALAHVRKPGAAKMPKIDQKACGGCHNPENSPNFQFSAYWRKIAH